MVEGGVAMRGSVGEPARELAREPVFLEIAEAEVPVVEAVSSYLFNSQLICTPDGSMWLVAAQECTQFVLKRFDAVM